MYMRFYIRPVMKINLAQYLYVTRIPHTIMPIPLHYYNVLIKWLAVSYLQSINRRSRVRIPFAAIVRSLRKIKASKHESPNHETRNCNKFSAYLIENDLSWLADPNHVATSNQSDALFFISPTETGL